jgi:hypothetical protein
MTAALIADAEALLAKLKAEFSPEIKVAENDAHAIVSDAASYIKTNGLQDLYQIALTLVGGMAPGASWATVLTSIVTQATADGKTLLAGAEGVVAAQAQADLLAAGKAAGLPTAA